LRENGGGNSSLGDLLVEYIYAGNYKSVSSCDVKISEEIIKYYQENNNLSEEELNYFKANIGEKYNYISNATRIYKDQPVFQGDTYFLIGRNTFSSAVMLASTVKDYNVGYLIGEETGGLPTDYGDIYSFKLPNTNLDAGVSYKYFVRPNGLNTGRGVLPDYYQKDVNKDALDIALDIIKTKRQ
jgi:C-terminal processing protease CtpA/Prc